MKSSIKFKLRQQIDKIDRQILNLLNKRAKFVIKLGKLKKKTGDEFYIPHREKEIISRVVKLNTGPLPKESITNIFNEILHSSRALQSKLKISYLGPKATFTHLAAIKNFGRYCNFIPTKTIADVFTEVEKGRADYGVVPIENSTEGVINHTLDMFIESELLICAELNLQIEHCLLSTETDLKKIKKVYSHTQALSQCRNWLEANLSEAQVHELNSTAEAAKLAKQIRGSSAIASAIASDLYGLKIIAQ
ncbi:MAG: chorismate mutase, partial [Elusimicrobiota bacterium]|nr:chorismate mutase [Elusimicrobiota bacterium]